MKASGFRQITLAISCSLLLSSSAVATNRYVTTTGTDADAAQDGICANPPSVAVSFGPTTISSEYSVMTITLSNNNATAADLSSAFVDTLPTGLKVLGHGYNTCGGEVDVDQTESNITLSSGTIPANGSCLILVKVTASGAGTYTNDIAPGALQTSNGPNINEASASLTVCNHCLTK